MTALIFVNCIWHVIPMGVLKCNKSDHWKFIEVQGETELSDWSEDSKTDYVERKQRTQLCRLPYFTNVQIYISTLQTCPMLYSML